MSQRQKPVAAIFLKYPQPDEFPGRVFFDCDDEGCFFEW